MAPADCEAMYRATGKEILLKKAYPNLLQGSGTVCAGHRERGACKVSMNITLYRSFM